MPADRSHRRLLSALALVCALAAPLSTPAGAQDGAGNPPTKFDQYWIVFLVRGDHPPQLGEQEGAELQRAHLAHLGKVWRSGHSLAAGPFEVPENEPMRGIVIYRGDLAEGEVRALAEADPAVRAGRLKVELKRWWTPAGGVSFQRPPEPEGENPAAPPPPFSIVEVSIPELQAALASGRVTSRRLVELYLQRIATYEDRLNAVVAIDPNALEEADRLDRERAAGRLRGPLHGIPVAVKDNVQTTTMPTTGGALAFAGLVPPFEATLVESLRAAGAIVLAKTQMTELANWVATGMPTNYSGLTGFGFNPYDPRRDPRDPPGDGRPALATGGSSSGAGTAASFWAASVGTETSGSILSPASQNLLAAVKPTVGRISRHGIIPITADQDTAGPMARSVTDAAVLLGVLEGAVPDPKDPATGRCERPPGGDYTRFLDPGALAGARIGIPRAYYYEEVLPPGAKEAEGGLDAGRRAVMDEAIATLRRLGAEVVDPADPPSMVAADPAGNLLLWPVCSGLDDAKGQDADCSIVFKYGMKRDFAAWLGGLGAAAPVASLGELRRWNVAHQKAGAIFYGQALLDISDEMDVAGDRERYQADRAKDLRLAQAEGLDAVFARHRLDALLFPANWGAGIAARAGYPSVIVPAGLFPNAPEPPFPAGFAAKAAPMGVTFTGLACSEPRLLALAYAFEQATRHRLPPPEMP